MRRWLPILRPNRPELRAAVILAVVMVAAAGSAIIRLRMFDIPEDCFGPTPEALCETYRVTIAEYGDAVSNLGNPAAIGTIVVPLLVALVFGIALVGRELEQQTTNFAWSIAPSRAAWLGDRLVPILLLLIAIGLAGGGLGDLLMGLRQRGVDPWQNFEGLGLRGPTIAAAGVLVFGLAAVVGSVVGRQLPALLIGGALIGFGVYGANTLSDAWVQGDAVVGTYDQVAIGDKVLDQLVRTPEGEFISWEEAYRRYGSEVETINFDGTVSANGFTVATRYVPGERYPAAVARLSGLLGLGGLVAIGLTFVVVNRRRPY